LIEQRSPSADKRFEIKSKKSRRLERLRFYRRSPVAAPIRDLRSPREARLSIARTVISPRYLVSISRDSPAAAETRDECRVGPSSLRIAARYAFLCYSTASSAGRGNAQRFSRKSPVLRIPSNGKCSSTRVNLTAHANVTFREANSALRNLAGRTTDAIPFVRGIVPGN